MPIHLLAAEDEDTFVVVAETVSGLLSPPQEGEAKAADAPASAFVEESTALLAQGKFEEYVAKLQPHLDLVCSKCSDKETECIANILVHAVARVPADRIPAASQSLAAALTSKVDERAEQRLGALLNLYGATSEQPTTQRAMLLSAASYARNLPNLAAILVPSVRGKSQEWVRLWKLNEAESRELLIALATLIKIGTDRASVKEYVRLVTAALGLCKEGDAAAIAQLRTLALAAVTDYIRSPSIYQADFAASPAVTALAKDKTASPVYSLFAATVSGDIKSFKSNAKPAVLEQVGVTAEAALTKARLVALIALCAGGSHKEVSFASIQQALDIPASAVEQWVVRAIGAKLIEGKIDQVQGFVVVTRCTQRTFGVKEWGALRDQLASWRESLHGATQLLGSMHASAAAGPVGMAGRPAISAAI